MFSQPIHRSSGSTIVRAVVDDHDRQFLECLCSNRVQRVDDIPSVVVEANANSYLRSPGTATKISFFIFHNQNNPQELRATFNAGKQSRNFNAPHGDLWSPPTRHPARVVSNRSIFWASRSFETAMKSLPTTKFGTVIIGSVTTSASCRMA